MKNQQRIQSLGPHDVISGRGGQAILSAGNRRYRQIVSKNKEEFLAATIVGKREIALKIVSMIHERGGRFLRKDVDDEGTFWMEMDHKQALAKTTQTLREKLQIRRHQQKMKEKIKERKARPPSLNKMVDLERMIKKQLETFASSAVKTMHVNAPAAENNAPPPLASPKVIDACNDFGGSRSEEHPDPIPLDEIPLTGYFPTNDVVLTVHDFKLMAQQLAELEPVATAKVVDNILTTRRAARVVSVESLCGFSV